MKWLCKRRDKTKRKQDQQQGKTQDNNKARQ